MSILVTASGASGLGEGPVIDQPDPTVSAIKALSYDILVANQGKESRLAYKGLISRLGNFQKKCKGRHELLPPNYQNTFLTPFFEFLSSLGEEEFGKIFPDKMAPRIPSDPGSSDAGKHKIFNKLIPVARDALLQRDITECTYDRDLRALQVVVSDLFHRVVVKNNIKTPDREDLLSPLVIWINSDTPSTWPKESLQKLDKQMGAGVVGLPSQFRHGGLAAWGALGHEVVGHNLLHAIPNLLNELIISVSRDVRSTKTKSKCNLDEIVMLWSSCVEETASDLLGILALGPSALISMLAYFRGEREEGKLKNKAFRHGNKTHPPDYLRIFMGIQVLKSFLSLKKPEIKTLADSLLKDIGRDEPKDYFEFIKLDEETDPPSIEFRSMPVEIAIVTAKVVVDTIMDNKLKCLKKQKLTDLINWTEEDEMKAYGIGTYIAKPQSNVTMAMFPPESDARHVLAGALMACSSIDQSDLRVKNIFDTMKELLALRYHSSSYWSPAGDITESCVR